MARRSPHLHRVAASGLGQAVEQGGHVPHVVGVQVRQEHLRRRGHRQAQPGEVLQRTRAQVEEEEVPLSVADLDQHRGRRLRGSDERVAAAQDRDPDLARGHQFAPRHQRRRERSARRPDNRRGGQRNVAALTGQLGHVVDLVTHGSCNPFIGGIRVHLWTSVDSVLRVTGLRPHPAGMSLEGEHPRGGCAVDPDQEQGQDHADQHGDVDRYQRGRSHRRPSGWPRRAQRWPSHRAPTRSPPPGRPWSRDPMAPWSWLNPTVDLRRFDVLDGQVDGREHMVLVDPAPRRWRRGRRGTRRVRHLRRQASLIR